MCCISPSDLNDISIPHCGLYLIDLIAKRTLGLLLIAKYIIGITNF